MKVEAAAKSSVGQSAAFGLLAFGIFATHDAVIKYLGSTYSVFQIIFFSVLFAFLPVTLMLTADRAHANLRPVHPWLVAMRTVTMMVGMACAFYAFTVLPLAETYALLFATPLLITALSVPLLGEVVRLRRWIAVIVGLTGVMIVLRPGYSALSLGHLAAIGAATCSAFSAIVVRKIGAEERSAVLILYPMLANMLAMSFIMPFVYQPVALVDLGLLATVGVMATVAQLFIIAAYRRAAAVMVAPLQYSQMLWAVLYGFLFFQDIPDKWVGVGATVIIASGLFVLWREDRRGDPSQKPVLANPNPRPDTGPSPRHIRRAENRK
ncbi:MAG: DMT family transporter [Stappiaceae bacterium]